MAAFKHMAMYILVVLLANLLLAGAYDSDPLQDVCVADLQSTIRVNGFPCKAPAPEDFKSAAIKNPGSTANALGSNVTAANVLSYPALNTLGVSFARIDYAPGGTNPPHIHPRASELLYLIQGKLLVGFITTGDNKLFAQILEPGELFVFPRGLIHFQLNIGHGAAFGVAGFNGQLPGTSQVAKAVFASVPPVSDAVLAKAFQLNPDAIQKLRALISKT